MTMRISYSTLPYMTQSPEECVKRYVAEGVKAIELFMEGSHFNELSTECLKELAEKLRAYPVSYSVHPPMFDINLVSENAAVREMSKKELEKAIVFAGLLSATHVVIDPGVRAVPVFDKKKAQQRAQAAIESLLPTAERHQVTLAIENTGCKEVALFNQKEYVSFVRKMDHPLVGYVVDTGHAYLAGWNLLELFEELKGEVVAVHVNDNTGRMDQHLPVGKGKILWKELFPIWKTYQMPPTLVLEYNTKTDLSAMNQTKQEFEKQL